jgi:hypothetical protein
MNYVAKMEDFLELTGGEPTLDPQLTLKMLIAKSYFEEVGMRTAYPKHVTPLQWQTLDTINVSAHNLDTYLEQPASDFIEPSVRAYLSIGLHQYSPDLPAEMYRLGWDGLSIWEDVWQNDGLKTDIEKPEVPNFSIRHLSAAECLDQLIILPDLDLVTGRQFEERFLTHSDNSFDKHVLNFHQSHINKTALA